MTLRESIHAFLDSHLANYPGGVPRSAVPSPRSGAGLVAVIDPDASEQARALLTAALHKGLRLTSSDYVVVSAGSADEVVGHLASGSFRAIVMFGSNARSMVARACAQIDPEMEHEALPVSPGHGMAFLETVALSEVVAEPAKKRVLWEDLKTLL